jgi:hypothetical protein
MVAVFLALFGFLAGSPILQLSAAELISGPTAETSGAGEVTIRWTTDVPTRGRVRIGAKVSQMAQRSEDGVTNRHAVTVRGLSGGQRYYYSVGTARLALATNSFSLSAETAAAGASTTPPRTEPSSTARLAPPARETWGQILSLPDHFDRHGRDFGAKTPDDYARMAWEFLQRARAEGLPAKIDDDGVLRVFDPKTRTFAAYNRDGTTRTSFKPESRDYFERQPGRPVNLKNWKEK